MAQSKGPEEQGETEEEDLLRQTLIRSMLRFRNMTGAGFDSAAEARYQVHDQPMTDSQIVPGEHEEKQTD